MQVNALWAHLPTQSRHGNRGTFMTPRSLNYRAVLAAAVAAVWSCQPRQASADMASPAGGDGSTGYRLASAWCMDCHAIEKNAVWTGKPAPNFVAVANLPSTTGLSLKVFLLSNHKAMPNFVISSGDADDLVAYILSLKRE
jgi:mono/diheme cytochrome c family protein